jgi:hypothetical protein
MKNQTKRKDKLPTGTTPTPVTKQQRDPFIGHVSGKTETKALSQSTLGNGFKIGNKPELSTVPTKTATKTATRALRRTQKASQSAKESVPTDRKNSSNRRFDASNEDKKQNSDDEQWEDDDIEEELETAWTDVVKRKKKGPEGSIGKSPGSQDQGGKPDFGDAALAKTKKQAELKRLHQAQQETRPNPFPANKTNNNKDKNNGSSKKVFGAEIDNAKSTNRSAQILQEENKQQQASTDSNKSIITKTKGEDDSNKKEKEKTKEEEAGQKRADVGVGTSQTTKTTTIETKINVDEAARANFNDGATRDNGQDSGKKKEMSAIAAHKVVDEGDGEVVIAKDGFKKVSHDDGAKIDNGQDSGKKKEMSVIAAHKVVVEGDGEVIIAKDGSKKVSHDVAAGNQVSEKRQATVQDEQQGSKEETTRVATKLVEKIKEASVSAYSSTASETKDEVSRQQSAQGLSSQEKTTVATKQSSPGSQLAAAKKQQLKIQEATSSQIGNLKDRWHEKQRQAGLGRGGGSHNSVKGGSFESNATVGFDHVALIGFRRRHHRCDTNGCANSEPSGEQAWDGRGIDAGPGH